MGQTLAEDENLREWEARMRVLLSRNGSRGDVQPPLGLAVQERARGAEAEESDVPVATSVITAGGWQ